MNLSAPLPNLNKACWGCSCSAAAGARLCRSPGGFANSDTLISACGTDSYKAGPGSGDAGVSMLPHARLTRSSPTPIGPRLLSCTATVGLLYKTQKTTNRRKFSFYFLINSEKKNILMKKMHIKTTLYTVYRVQRHRKNKQQQKKTVAK